MSPQIIQQLLEKYNFTPTKIRGQNFLIDDGALEAIAAAGKIDTQDTVVEIGPGFGFLTRVLAAKAKKVLALEIDTRAVAALQEELKNYYKGAPCSNVEIILGDALKFDFSEYQISPNNYLLIANIPYQITNKIFEKFLLGNFPPKRAVLLMQREVGERILARDGEQNALSVTLQSAYAIERVTNVSREKFYPVPKVDSVVLAFSYQQSPPTGFFDFVHQGFRHPKKKLINNLTTLFSRSALTANFDLLGIDLAVRPVKIAPEAWLRLFDELKIR